jgi:hypothetical protein
MYQCVSLTKCDGSMQGPRAKCRILDMPASVSGADQSATVSLLNQWKLTVIHYISDVLAYLYVIAHGIPGK